MNGVRHFVGLDLGSTQEYTALAVLERARSRPAQRWPVYALRHLARFPPGTPYPAIAAAVRDMLQTPPLPGAVLGVDHTGVGRAILEHFDAELRGRVWCLFCPVTIVGRSAGGEAVGLVVPKLELVATLQVLLQTRRLRVADGLPESGVLIRELEVFQTQAARTRGEGLDDWRMRDHDDLVLAVAVAAWLGESARSQEEERR